jgi:hypothetical protein
MPNGDLYPRDTDLAPRPLRGVAGFSVRYKPVDMWIVSWITLWITLLVWKLHIVVTVRWRMDSAKHGPRYDGTIGRHVSNVCELL